MKHQPPQRKIIIAAPEEPLLRVLAQRLSLLGVEVATVRSHGELRRRCRNHHYELIISRFISPLLSSHDEVSRLKGRGPGTHIFVLSHTRDERVVVSLLERGVNQFLSLPVSSSRLARKVHTRLAKYQTLC